MLAEFDLPVPAALGSIVAGIVSLSVQVASPPVAKTESISDVR